MTELKIYGEDRKSFHDGVQFAWDATSISAWQKCPQYYKLKILEGWRPNTESEHLRFGGHYATALEHYYKYVALGQSWEEALEQVVLEAMISTWDHEYEADVRIPGTGGPWVSFDNNKTRETLIRSIIWYVDQFHDEEIHVLHHDGVPLVEHSFALPVDNDIIFTGHLDRVVEFSDDPYVMDQKTTGSTITPKYFRQFKPNVQFSMYTFAGKTIWNIPVKGVIIDAAQIAVGFTRFERDISYRTEGELNEWYDHTMGWITHAQGMTREQFFPLNPQSCNLYGGCEFHGICEKSPGLRENFLKGGFTQHDPWDPLERR